ncbi:unnamed protein product [Ilex paraguariensis]|uniref:LOB domain-containing protein n=1 Tax=Ilex paraguariensis TaxID=185542 RepID=A0ABC8T3B4_9AQUA
MQRNNGMPACASCKHQRKKCTDDCTLANFFPVNKTREFEAVHKVFGVSNLTKMVKNVKEEDRKRASDSLIWEALCRQKDPVLGSFGEYMKLYEELKLYKSQCQVPLLEGLAHKSAPDFIGWNNNGKMDFGGVVNTDAYNYIHDNGNSLVDSCQHGFAEKLRQVRENGSLGILPQQQSVIDFNQQYYL